MTTGNRASVAVPKVPGHAMNEGLLLDVEEINAENDAMMVTQELSWYWKRNASADMGKRTV